jgi:hypothetical protein
MLEERIHNKIALPKIDFEIDENEVEEKYKVLIQWFINNLPRKVKINNETINQFLIPTIIDDIEIAKIILYIRNNHMYPKMDLQLYLKSRNINIWTSFNKTNQIEVYYSFII